MNACQLESLSLANRRAWALRWRSRFRSRATAMRVYKAQPAPSSDETATLKDLRGQALHILAWHAKWMGDFAAAESYGNEARQDLEGSGQRITLADTLSTLAVVKIQPW